jgi:hypothetical protein
MKSCPGEDGDGDGVDDGAGVGVDVDDGDGVDVDDGDGVDVDDGDGVSESPGDPPSRSCVSASGGRLPFVSSDRWDATLRRESSCETR